MDADRLALVGSSAIVAGLVNAVAGGGSLISFPALVAAGVPAVTANLTNTVALCPGYFGGTFAQRRDLVGQRSRVVMLLPVSMLGGALGALLLLWTGERAFDAIVPFLLLLAVALFALQSRLQAFVKARSGGERPSEAWAVVPVGIAAIYGGYFGAGLSVIVLGSLVVVADDTLLRLNALKQMVSLAVNASAAVVFVVAGRLDWTVTFVMAVAALVGGAIGGTIASRVPAKLLRGIVMVAGLAMAIVYFTRLWAS
jgi:uncharacterized membrane protein YfcA